MPIKSKFAFVFVFATTLPLSSASYAQSQFGSAGRDGDRGASGADGQSGRSIEIIATGQSESHDISGRDGGAARSGEPGYNATGCSQGEPSYDLFGAAGGDGGMGGNGGSGGDGGNITVYYEDLANLRSLAVRDRPGYGGQAAWGGRGADGCRCQTGSWVIGTGTDARTYHCRDGSRGSDAQGGQSGPSGSYGAMTLIKQLTPLGPNKPTVQIDMSDMLNGPVTVAQNYWDRKSGARALFQSGSEIADNYLAFRSRTEINYSFKWEVARPLSDFANWPLWVQLENGEAKLYLADNLWAEGEVTAQGNERVYTFRRAVSTGEVGNFGISAFEGVDAAHAIVLEDYAGAANVMNNAVHLKYFSAENGTYKLRYDADVPGTALEVTARNIRINVGQLGIDPLYLKRGVQAYAGLVVKRTVGTHSATYNLGQYYTITLQLEVGNIVKVNADADLYVGNQVVGQVKRDEVYKIRQIQGDWIALAKMADGTAVNGWVQRSFLDLN